VTEETERIIGERQLALLRELAAKTADARTVEDACTLAASAIRTNPNDLPFALIYTIDAKRRSACLTGISGLARGHKLAPETVDLDEPSLWPFKEVLGTQRAYPLSDLTAFSEELPAVREKHRVTKAVSMLVAGSGETGTAGVLIAGLSPLLAFDDSYQRFLELVAGGISEAITNGRAYEAERKRAEALAEIDRAKTAFFSNVSHEFRTPLTLILGPIEDALAETTDGGQRDRLELMRRNALRLQKLVNTLLDFSRIEAGRIQATYEPTDLAELTTELASVFRSAIEKAGLRLIVNCPPLSEPVYVDLEMWEKIVLNLLSNAFKFTFQGEIEVSLRQVGDQVELVVRDSGTGIPTAELPRLFERFHRVQNARSRSFEGSGIGLALVQELVKLHGGTVGVESEVEQG